MTTSCDIIPNQALFRIESIQDKITFSTENCFDDIDIVYICLEDQSLGFQTSVELRNQFGQVTPPIIVRMPEDSGMATIVSSGARTSTSQRNIHPFGLIERTCTPDLVLRGTHELLAQAVHVNYLKTRMLEGVNMGQKRSMVPWDVLPEDLRESNRRQVDLIRWKLERSGYEIKPLVDWDASQLQFREDEIELMARLEHEHWLEERRQAGWSYAPGNEDTERKTHPDLVPWDTLSDHAKEKDRQTVVMLPKLLAQAGFQLVPQAN
jgi:hypothetical protein